MKNKMKRLRNMLMAASILLMPLEIATVHAKELHIENAAFTYNCTSADCLEDVEANAWLSNPTDQLLIQNTDADYLVTGVYRHLQNDTLMYTLLPLGEGYCQRYQMNSASWEEATGAEQLQIGDLIQMPNAACVDSLPPQIFPSSEVKVVGNSTETLGEPFSDVILHELKLSRFYGIGKNQITNYSLLPVPETLLTMGDTNQDQQIDIIDVIATNRFLLGASTLTEKAELAADIDWNGTVDSTDSLMLLKEVVGITTNFAEP